MLICHCDRCGKPCDNVTEDHKRVTGLVLMVENSSQGGIEHEYKRWDLCQDCLDNVLAGIAPCTDEAREAYDRRYIKGDQ